jgi:cyclopropane-fatty-acyl-phospholipid synthase
MRLTDLDASTFKQFLIKQRTERNSRVARVGRSAMSLADVYSYRIKLFNNMFLGYVGPAFDIQLPSWSWRSASSEPIFSLIFRSSETIDRLFLNASEAALGEAFISGDLDVKGDIFSAFDVVEWLLNRHTTLGNRILGKLNRDWSALVSVLTRGRKHSKRRDAASIHYHYDLPVEFYEAWLGPTLLYSSAYFRSPADVLDTAQIDKLDLICRKLDIHPGDRFLDIGCGWGSLPIHAASRYGARARGITISRDQAQVAARRISNEHVEDLCIVENLDYRDALSLPCRFDKIASIGMIEHVGVKNMSKYFRVALNLLKPGGRFLNSGIVRSAGSPLRTESFIDQYVFPDGELATLTETLRAAEESGLEIRDVESLREHYARTLRLWVTNLLGHTASLLQIVSERTLRTWMLYMAGSAAAFERGDISVYQVLLRRPSAEHNNELSTREPWYANSQPKSNHIAA